MKRLDQISLKQLRALQLVVEYGTISAAAEVMGVTGPAIHSQLKNLEDSIGASLLYREGRRRNSLTPEGMALVQANSEIRATLERALMNINALAKGHTGCVVLGAVSTAKYFAPRIVALIERDFPQIEVVLKIANRSETIAALEIGEMDLCIMGRPPRQPLTQATALADHPHILIAAPDHPLLDNPTISASDLLNERFIMRELGSGTRMLAERYLDQLSEALAPRKIEMDSNETIKQAVISGLGIAMISAHTVAEELATGRLRPLHAIGTPVLRKWYVLNANGFSLSPTALTVRTWMIENADSYFPEIALV